MGDIVKGVLGGGWSLLVGWILPSAINLLILGFLVVPDFEPLDWRKQGPLMLAGAAVLGLILASLQTPLYRLLSGLVGWRPGGGGPLNWSYIRQKRHWRVLNERVDYMEMTLAAESKKGLREGLRERFEALKGGETAARHGARDLGRTATQRGLLRERRDRYPASEDQVVPTRLGNAIRRVEEYSYDRFRLDSQRLANEMYAVGSEMARKQVDQARTTIDFFVCLLYGHLIVAFVALVAGPHRIGAAVLAALSGWWYDRAVKATDDWAGATRALANLARKPLAANLGLKLPSSLDKEREMWAAVSRMAQRRHDDRSAELDTFRDSG